MRREALYYSIGVEAKGEEKHRTTKNNMEEIRMKDKQLDGSYGKLLEL